MPKTQATALRTRAYSYLRFSSPEQAKGASRRRQIEAAETWARDHGLTLDEHLRDEGVSAYSGRNREPTSALGGFMAKVQGGEVPVGSYLIVESFDRLSRQQVVDALTQFLVLIGAGITVVTLADGRVYNRESLREDATQLVISILIMTRAFEESDTKSKRVAHAWRLKREAARNDRQAMTAICPGWIRLVGGPKTGNYELIEERATIVRGMFEAVIAGDGRRTIVKRLNAAGVTPWGVGGNQAKFWHDSYVQKILGSTAVFGRYETGGASVEGYFPAVISEETYWKAKAATRSRYFGTGRAGKVFNNLLTGIAKCPECGSNMTYLDKGRRSSGPTLRCTKALAAAGCASDLAPPYADLEMLTFCLLVRFKDFASFTAGEARKAAGAVDALQERLAVARAKSDNLAMAIADGGEIRSLRRLVDVVESEIVTLEEEIAELNVRLAADQDNGPDAWTRSDELLRHMHGGDDEQAYARRKAFNARLRRYVDRLVILEEGIGFRIHYKGTQNPVDETVQPDPTLTKEELLRADAAYDEAKTEQAMRALGWDWTYPAQPGSDAVASGSGLAPEGAAAQERVTRPDGSRHGPAKKRGRR